MTLSIVALLGVITLPEVFYAWIWLRPQYWRRRFGDGAVEAFALVTDNLKRIRLAAMTIWIVSNTGNIASLLPAPHNNFLGITSAILLIAGKGLDQAACRALGRNNLYYGIKLGSPGKWVEGFPFNVVSHPIYVGRLMIFAGVGGLFWNHLPAGGAFVLLYWSALYVINGLKEQYL